MPSQTLNCHGPPECGPPSWAETPESKITLRLILLRSSVRHLGGPHLRAMTLKKLLPHAREAFGGLGPASFAAVNLVRQTGFQRHTIGVVDQLLDRAARTP